MRKLFTLALAGFTICATAQPIQERIKTNDPAKYRELTGVHAGAGKMGFTQLIGSRDLATNFLYLHSGKIAPKSGIGHHFHHTIEEMYVILNGEAEFTVDGRTSTIKAPAVVPCKMGDSHGIYNASNESIQWLNFAVSNEKGGRDNFDLDDDRVGAKLDPKPVFVSARLEKDKLKENPAYEGDGIRHRRLLGPAVFRTDWNYVDHLAIPSGSALTPRQLLGTEEVYYVVEGQGTVTIAGEKGNINKDDAFYGKLGEQISLSNTGSGELQLLVIGISAPDKKGWEVGKPLQQPKSIVLQMDFVVPKEKGPEFEKMYYSIYVPAMTVQDGYLSSKVLRMFPENISKEIQAEPTTYNYQIQIEFDSEENRRKWVASEQHKLAWPAAAAIATEYKWRGYDVMGDDDQD